MDIAIRLFSIIAKHKDVLDKEDKEAIQSIEQELSFRENKYNNNTNIQNLNRLAKMAKEGDNLSFEDIATILTKV